MAAKPTREEQKVAVVYYLSRNGELDHPHFMEVPLSSPQGLYLRDVKNRLNNLRGQGLANMYSWSSKRSYKNGFVWQDLAENDFIYPSQGGEFILKGSQILKTSLSCRSSKTVSSASSFSVSETNRSSSDSNLPSRNRSRSASDADRDEHRLYKAKTPGEFSGDAMDASTQTDDNRGRIGGGVAGADIRDQTAGNDRPSGRIRASAVLIQLIACGARGVRDGDTSDGKEIVDGSKNRVVGS